MFLVISILICMLLSAKPISYENKNFQNFFIELNYIKHETLRDQYLQFKNLCEQKLMLCLERKCSLLEVAESWCDKQFRILVLTQNNINWLFTMECSFVKMVACCVSFLLENVPK